MNFSFIFNEYNEGVNVIPYVMFRI